jgi:Ni/Fe-hydrogenase subunit HybB-like protein
VDILERGTARTAFAAFDVNTLLYVIEIGLGILLPLILFSNRSVRESTRGTGFTASLVLIFGGTLNRLNVSVTAMDHSPLGYIPTFIEYLYIPVIIVLMAGVYVIITRVFPILEPKKS